jgi:peptidoglycan/LPS O-acetylase OafA/YrhL
VFSAHGVIAYFGFAQVYDSSTLPGGISPAWSLCVEVTFYAMLPVWALGMRRLRSDSTDIFVRTELRGLAVLFLIGAAWTSVAAAHAHVDPAIFVDPTRIARWFYVLPAYLDHFAVGMALAVVSVAIAERPTPPRIVRLVERASWLPWLIAGVAYFAMAHVDWLFPNSYALQVVSTHELQAVFALALLLPAVFGDPRRGLVRRLLANRALLWIGLVSYAVYLWHAPIIAKLIDLGALNAFSPVEFIGATLGITLLVAAASFYAVERPALRLGRRSPGGYGSQDPDVRMRDLGRHEREG